MNSDIRARALNVFPAGISNGEFGLPAEALIVVAKGEGARLWDVTGREYLDFSIGWGSALVGHACPEVVEAVRGQALNGSNFAYLNEPVLHLAEEIRRISRAAQHLRFCASGTEATSTASGSLEPLWPPEALEVRGRLSRGQRGWRDQSVP